MNLHKMKKWILCISIFIVCILIIMIGITLFQKEEEIQEEREILDQGNKIPTSYEKKILTEHSTFFSVADCVQKYLNSLSLNTDEISNKPVTGSKMRSAVTIYAENQNITDEASKKEAIYNFLNENYVKQNQITKNNILDKIEDKEAVEFIPMKMYELLGNNKSQYAVYGRTQEIESKEEKDVYFIVNVDKTNHAFNLIPVAFEEYDDLNDIPLEEKDESIEQNKNNVFSYQIMQENEIVQKYFTYFKRLMQENPEMAYDILDEEYRNKRFGNIEEFKNYIDKNQEEIKGYLAREYETKKTENGTEYICSDQYQHYYIFQVSAVMQFSVKLDNYTIESEEVKHKYEIADDKRKIEMNTDKWILMLNYRDYHAAFEALDETFREKNFENEEKFESYMRRRFPDYYGLHLSDFSKEAGVYIQEILLTDIRAKKDMVLPETIIMKLTEDGFKMSFRILT